MLWHHDEDTARALDQQLGSAYSDSAMPDAAPLAKLSMAMPDWERMLKQTDEGFSEALLRQCFTASGII